MIAFENNYIKLIKLKYKISLTTVMKKMTDTFSKLACLHFF